MRDAGPRSSPPRSVNESGRVLGQLRRFIREGAYEVELERVRGEKEQEECALTDAIKHVC